MIELVMLIKMLNMSIDVMIIPHILKRVPSIIVKWCVYRQGWNSLQAPSRQLMLLFSRQAHDSLSASTSSI